MVTLTEMMEWLKHLDEVTLLETLDISSEDLVDRFEDKVEEQYEKLAKEIEGDREYQDEDPAWGSP